MFSGIQDYINDKKFSLHVYNDTINIINFKNIITLENERISISSTDKVVVIKGKDLYIKKLLDNEVLIVGKIGEIKFNEI